MDKLSKELIVYILTKAPSNSKELEVLVGEVSKTIKESYDAKFKQTIGVYERENKTLSIQMGTIIENEFYSGTPNDMEF